MSTKILQETLKSNPSSIIDLYEADFSTIGELEYLRFYDGSTFDYQNLVWNSNIYTAFPMQITGFEWDGSGKLPTPKMTVSNIGGFMSAFNMQYNDLLGVKIIRKRTFLKFLDAVNFENDTNPDADNTAEFPTEIYYIDRKSAETPSICEYELASALDLTNSQLPRRTITQNICMWKYKSSECGYTGVAMFDEFGNATAIPASDKCGKRLSDCEKRFYSTGERIVNFGGFPGAGLMR